MNTSRKLLIAGAAALASMAVASTAAAQATANGTGSASVKIITPISITPSATQKLSFGVVVPNTSTGTVIVTPAGAGSATGGATLLASSTTSAQAFTVAGEPSQTYTLDLPASSVNLTDANNHTVSVDTWTTDLVRTNNLATLDNSGAGAFNVGATLNVPANAPAGTYSGSFVVTVAYN